MNPFGYRITYERLSPRTGRPEQVICGRKARPIDRNDTIARSSVALKTNFVRIVSSEPLTEAQYRREFPEGHGQKGRFVSFRA